jgi:hypothetical protein
MHRNKGCFRDRRFLRHQALRDREARRAVARTPLVRECARRESPVIERLRRRLERSDPDPVRQLGQILTGDVEQVAVDGRVTPSGAVRVTVAAGNQEAQGAGRLLRPSGGGTWRG